MVGHNNRQIEARSYAAWNAISERFGANSLSN
jgi:hypothetical protein